MLEKQTPEHLQQIVREAAEIVGELPDALKPVAFAKVFDCLVRSDSGDTATTRRTSARRRPARLSHDGAVSRTPKKTHSADGPKRWAQALVDEAFFVEPKTVENVRLHLSDKSARTVGSKELSKVLIRLVREGKLAREKNADGKFAYRTK